MKLQLIKAGINDAKEIHAMQIVSFSKLLAKYSDFETNPGAETIDRIINRLEQSITDYYFINMDDIHVGAIRIVRLKNGKVCRISPIFILPEYQNNKIAQNVFGIIETMYHPENGWILDTILEEIGNCHLYEKVGYRKTGKVERINEKMQIVHYEKI